MARSGKKQGEEVRREEPGRSGAPRDASGSDGSEIDLREEEGWTQPESSAQKGVEPDES
jgi:hypothetical protein